MPAGRLAPGRVITTTTKDGRPLTYAFEEVASGPSGEAITEPWTDMAGALARYRRMLREYQLFGDGSAIDLDQACPAPAAPAPVGAAPAAPGWY